MEDKNLELTEHLEELRRRIIYSIIFYAIAIIIGFVFSGKVMNYLKNAPAARGLSWNVFALSDALTVYIKISMILGTVLAIPFILYQIWAFVKPGLKKHEQKIALRFIPAATFLFIFGIGFSYWVIFPMIVDFMKTITEQVGANEIYGIHQYFNFMFRIIIPFGILFELPIIAMFLTRLRIVNPRRLARMRKYAYFVLFIIAASITPPELISEIMVTIPLILLYEFSIWLSKLVYKKQQEEDIEVEQEFSSAD
ncbi:twin-arginine translocase subunit TatC [Microaerobacter geothermalis]|uniref:twin-arginine translocase subunit TatC n=1 Tax=Microaerobacter geothermalis TaxID=674972 RepID=UPI001F23E736|nr:twin-arginine translocase subunit TatC [Microaerobacter geothermalis]MCF6092645.1 twin-arginine translocase subunit TatC [Microaerobacter geothermalis]